MDIQQHRGLHDSLLSLAKDAPLSVRHTIGNHLPVPMDGDNSRVTCRLSEDHPDNLVLYQYPCPTIEYFIKLLGMVVIDGEQEHDHTQFIEPVITLDSGLSNLDNQARIFINQFGLIVKHNTGLKGDLAVKTSEQMWKKFRYCSACENKYYSLLHRKEWPVT